MTNPSTSPAKSQIWTDSPYHIKNQKPFVADAPAAVAPPKASPISTRPKASASPLPVPVPQGHAESDLRADAAEMVRVHRLTYGRWPKVMAWKAWEQVGARRASIDGCSLIEGIKREGYLHPYVSQADHGNRSTPGAKPLLTLTKKQTAERATAWAQFKGISVIAALNHLGIR